MLKLLLSRLATAIPSIVGVVVVTFMLTRLLPGDPAAYFAGLAASPQAIAEVRTKLGLDKTLPEQFVTYIGDLLHGNLGNSLSTGQPVVAEIATRLPASAELTLFALILAVAIAIPLGVLAAVKQGTWIDHLCRIVTTAGVSLPVFFTGLLFAYVFYYLLQWAPAPTGRLDVFLSPPTDITGFYLIDSALTGNLETFWGALRQLALPAISMAIFSLAPLARMTRGSMLAVLGSDFIRTAHAMGLPRLRIIVAYALRNALLPVLTITGIVFSTMLGANVLVEKVFSWPGVASYALDALLASDYAPVQAFVLLMASIFVLVNVTIDVLYGIADPRVSVA